LGIQLLDWAVAALTFVLAAGVVRLVIRIALGRMQALAGRTRTGVDDAVARVLRATRGLFVLLVALWAASETLPLVPAVEMGLRRTLVIGMLVQAALWANAALGF